MDVVRETVENELRTVPKVEVSIHTDQLEGRRATAGV